MTTATKRGYMPAAQKEDWRTPPEVLKIVSMAFGGTWDSDDLDIALDPCASPDLGHHFATFNVWLPADGLACPWIDRTFVNPPFGDLARWTEKCEAEGGRTVKGVFPRICLLTPSRTDTRYWQDVILDTATAICFLRGRLKFVGAPAPCPFPTALVWWNGSVSDIRNACNGSGKVVIL